MSNKNYLSMVRKLSFKESLEELLCNSDYWVLPLLLNGSLAGFQIGYFGEQKLLSIRPDEEGKMGTNGLNLG